MSLKMTWFDVVWDVETDCVECRQPNRRHLKRLESDVDAVERRVHVEIWYIRFDHPGHGPGIEQTAGARAREHVVRTSKTPSNEALGQEEQRRKWLSGYRSFPGPACERLM
jgi:hypothetical protein